MGKHPPAEQDRNPRKTLEDYLKHFGEVRAELERALKDQVAAMGLDAALNAKVETYIQSNRVGGCVDPKKLTDFIHQTEEQQEIEDARRRRKKAEQDLRSLWGSMQLYLDQLRSPETRDAFAILDTLPSYHGLHETDRRMSLVRVILRNSTSTKSRRKHTRSRGGENSEALDNLRIFVRQIHKELVAEGYKGDLHQALCRRLHNHPRPPGAAWKDLSWPRALRNPTYRKSVQSWLSKEIHRRV